MKTTLLVSAAAVFCSCSFAALPAARPLPAPRRTGGMPLQQALGVRKTIRSYKADALTDQQIADLLWSANGVNRKDGKRTAPSAVNRKEINLYYLTAQGAFSYNPETNQVVKVSGEDLRKWAGRFEAPVYIVLSADLKRAASRHYAVMDTGYVSQNIYLHCASSGLGTCAIGSFGRIKGGEKGKLLHDKLGMPETEEILLTHSVGIPAEE
jgi:nitroreductase